MNDERTDVARVATLEAQLARMTADRGRVQVALEEADEATARESARADRAEERCDGWRMLALARSVAMQEDDFEHPACMAAVALLAALGVNPYEEP